MLGIHDLPLFIASGLLLNITPGADSLLIMTRSATQGWRAGSAAALGIGAGTVVHVLAGALGLSALLSASATAFALVKYAGAAYLVYLGLSLLFKRPADDAGRAPAPNLSLPYRRIFMQGLTTNVLNPKVALFFLAFVPQFIGIESPSKPVAFIVLGTIFNINSMIWCHLLAFGTAGASRRLRFGPGVQLWLHRAIGGLFLSFGLKLALAER